MRRVRRCGLQRRDHHVLDLLGADTRGPTRPGLVDQPVEAALQEPGPPPAHRGPPAPPPRPPSPPRPPAPPVPPPPPAQPTTTRDGTATAAPAFPRRDHRPNCSR